jgi:hypothetical protein
MSPSIYTPVMATSCPFTKKLDVTIFIVDWWVSNGTGLTDECIFNLRGKALEFNFSPAETVNSSDKTNSLLFKSLKTFRLL